jgi:hypothetical protein
MSFAGRVLADEVARVAAADAGRLHPPVGGEVGGAEREALHARRGAADLLDVGHAEGRLEDRVHEERAGEPGLGLELGEQPVDVVDVLGALNLGDHDDVELVADLGHERREVVERPGAVQRVDPGPELSKVTEIRGLADRDQPGPRCLFVVGLDGVLEVAEKHVDGPHHLGDLGRHLGVARVEEVDDPCPSGFF